MQRLQSQGGGALIAESFERIFRQNCDNIGIFTSTDFGLIACIQRGEAISVEELVRDREPLSADLLRSGGLLCYGKNHTVTSAATAVEVVPGPRTLAQKIIERHAAADSLRTPGEGGFAKVDWRFTYEYDTGMIVSQLQRNFGHPAPLLDKDP